MTSITAVTDQQSADIVLEARGLTREFKGFVAVDNVNLQVRRGDIHVLIGPNGAGKSTCFNLLTKFLEPTRGEIFLNGADITSERATRVARRGMVRSFQISSVFPHLTVLDNVTVALQRHLNADYCFWRPLTRVHALRDKAMGLLTRVGLQDYQSIKAVELPYGRKRALEIATTLALEPEVMLLDEPTQGMGHEDVDKVMRLIKDVSRGRTILMVEHNMKVVSGISDRITVLSRGAVLAEGSYTEVSALPEVIEAYMGGTNKAETRKRNSQ